MVREKPVTASERQRRVTAQVPNKYVRRKKSNTSKSSNSNLNSTIDVEIRTLTTVQPLIDSIDTAPTLEEALDETNGDTRDPITKDVIENDGADGGPIDKSVLKSFESHVSYVIWNRTELERSCLRMIHHYPKLNAWNLKEEVSGVQCRVARSGLLNVVEHCYRYIDYLAVSAFVERWQPETNTFHLPFGEMTITLDDVKHILGVPVEGDCVCAVEGGRDIKPMDALNMLVELLGVDLVEAKKETKRHYAVRLQWLKNIFMKKATDDSDDDELDKCARAYIMYMLGCAVYPDKTKSRISIYYLGCLRDLSKVGNFAWGMGILSHLYRQLGLVSRVGARQMTGCLTLLVAWIYDHFPGYGRAIPNMEYNELEPRMCKWKPQHVTGDSYSSLVKLREQLDDLSMLDVCWDPYKDDRDAHPFQEISYYNGLLVCFDIGEAYYPDRVLRQFGRVQTIPKIPIMEPLKNTRGKKEYKLTYDLNKWHRVNWRKHLLPTKFRSQQAINPWDCSADYLKWYLNITHPIIQVPIMRATPKRIPGEAEQEISRLKSEVEKAKVALQKYMYRDSNAIVDPELVVQEAHEILARITNPVEHVPESELRKKKKHDSQPTKKKGPATKKAKK